MKKHSQVNYSAENLFFLVINSHENASSFISIIKMLRCQTAQTHCIRNKEKHTFLGKISLITCICNGTFTCICNGALIRLKSLGAIANIQMRW